MVELTYVEIIIFGIISLIPITILGGLILLAGHEVVDYMNGK